MSGDADAQAELLRKFQAAISGMELADLHRLAGDLSLMGGEIVAQAARPELRRPPLGELQNLRVRVDLNQVNHRSGVAWTCGPT